MSVFHPTVAGHGRDLASSSSSGQQPAGPIAKGAAGGKRPGRALAARPDDPPTRQSFIAADQSQQTSRNSSRSGLSVEGQQVGEPPVGASEGKLECPERAKSRKPLAKDRPGRWPGATWWGWSVPSVQTPALSLNVSYNPTLGLLRNPDQLHCNCSGFLSKPYFSRSASSLSKNKNT